MKLKLPLRKEGVAKVTGKAIYVDDIHLPNMLYGVTVRSQISRGKIKSISYKSGVNWEEFTIVTHKDIPGKNAVTLLGLDQPFLAEKHVNHYDEAILLLAHPDKHMAEKARDLVHIEYEKQKPVYTIEDSLKQGEIIWGKDNIFKSYTIKKGDPKNIWKTADFVIEGEYHTGAQEQLYIENNGIIAIADPDSGVTIWGSMQCPYYIHKGIVPLFGVQDHEVRVIQSETGGGFGGKEEYPTLLAGHAALLAWKSGQPVKMIYSRSEDLAATTKRHPSKTKIKTAHSSDGALLGIEIDFYIDGGAYMTLSPVVLSRGTIHATGPYRCENTLVRSSAVATNHPPHGAFRGFGAPQSIFAFERHLNRAAEQIGISEIQIRKINFLKKGDKTATGQLIKEDLDFNGLLDRTLKLSDYEKKQSLYKEHNKKNSLKKGIGLATFMHGAGFTGSGEKYLDSVVKLEATAQGIVKVFASSTEIGQGTNTVFSQIVSENLNIPFEKVEIVQPDTLKVPNSGPTVASRTVMIVGGLVQRAALELKAQMVAAKMLKTEHSSEDFTRAAKEFVSRFGQLISIVRYQAPEGVEWDDKHYRGEAYATYAWACYVADIEVDTVTYETKVKGFIASQEVGRVLHKTLAEGQIEGGVAQGIGYALYEKVVYKDGRVANPQMTNYIMPTSVDVPDIKVIFEERHKDHGPGGAKGIGELPMDGPGPAIINALSSATDLDLNFIPFLPEDLHAKYKEEHGA